LTPDGLLDTPIQDAAGVAKVDRLDLQRGGAAAPGFHTGVLPGGGAQNPPAAAGQQPAGVHHYPTPVADIQLVKFDDFQLWLTDGEGKPATVAPVAQRGSGDASVHVLYATPGSQLARQSKRLKAPIPR
jgi:hypothetical protein